MRRAFAGCADREHFGMGCRVAVGFATVEASADHFMIPHNDGADRHFTDRFCHSCLCNRSFHPMFIFISLIMLSELSLFSTMSFRA